MPAVPLPENPTDPMVRLPAAPSFPPSVTDVKRARFYRKEVEASIQFKSPLSVKCTSHDQYNAAMYEHRVLAQAAAAADGEAPPWFQGAMQQLRADIHNDLQQLRADFHNDLQQLRTNFRNAQVAQQPDNRDIEPA